MVKIITPPAVEPVSINDFKTWMRGVPISAEQESTIKMLLKAGREEAEKHQNAAYIEQTLQIAPDVISGAILLPRPPFKELISVVCYDTNDKAIDITDKFAVNDISFPAEIRFKDGETLPTCTLRTYNPFLITYKAGMDIAAIPEKVKQAILLYAAWAFQHPGGEEPIPQAFYALLSKGRVVPV